VGEWCLGGLVKARKEGRDCLFTLDDVRRFKGKMEKNVRTKKKGRRKTMEGVIDKEGAS